MSKKKVLLLSIHYPLTMALYFERALRRRNDVEVRTVGPYTGSSIPWMGGMTLPAKYANPPTYQIPMEPQPMMVDWRLVQAQLKDWVPDLIITVDAGINWAYRPNVPCPVVTVGTDGHCLNYDRQRKVSDKFFNMHKHYMKGDDIWLPYAADFSVHFMESTEHTSDCVLIGMPYKHRIDMVKVLRSAGISVIFENGPILDEYRKLNCAAGIGLNYSSEKDLNARVFELMAMGRIPVINRVPDLKEVGFEEGIHYLGFDTVSEALEQVRWSLLNTHAAYKIANQAHSFVSSLDINSHEVHSYDARIQTLLECVGLV